MSDKFVCLYILKITMNEWKSIYRKKKNIFQQNNFNLFAVLIGFIIGSILWLNVYAKGEQRTYDTYPIATIREQAFREIPITVLDSRIGSWVELIPSKWPVVSWGDWVIKEVNQRWTEHILRVKGFASDTDATKIINYAYKISGGDMDFILTLKAENWGFNMYQQSNVVKNWIREDSRWLCQLNRKRHKEVDTKEFWESWEYQVDVCWRKYKWWTKFYGYNVRNRYKDQFYWE